MSERHDGNIEFYKPPLSIEEIEAHIITEEQRESLRCEIAGYRTELENGGYPELPTDISLIAELAEVEYDPAKYEQKAGVYSNRDIKEALLDGHIRIYPYVEANLQGTSYDITLGDWFYGMDKVHNRTYYNPKSKADVERYFAGPYQAVANEQWCRKQFRDSFEFTEGASLWFRNIPRETSVIVLNEGERVLAHTHEFIGIDGPGTMQMQARSSFGRNGKVVCKDAGWGDPGYKNRWTMEIQNDNNERVPLEVGSRPGQIIFYSSGRVQGSYTEEGKYHQASPLLENLATWHPTQMLPRSYNDESVQPTPLEAGIEHRLGGNNE